MAFHEAPQHTRARDAVVVSPDMSEPPVILIRRGMAYRSATLANGRRAILDFFLTNDVVGCEHVASRPAVEIKAVTPITYSALPLLRLRELMARPQIAVTIVALLAEERQRRDQHIVGLTRLDAHARISAFLVGIYDRLRQSELVGRPTFVLPLTQDQIADHLGLTMVHVSRTLRRLREERLALITRQVVIITDLPGLRRAAGVGQGAPDD